MAKKSRRVRKKGRKVRLSETQLSAPGMAKEGGPLASTAPAEAMTELREEYRHVGDDFKRLGIIAGVLLAVAIVLVLVLV